MYFLKPYRRGVFVKYRKGMPIPEMISKDLKFLFKWVLNYFKSGFHCRTIYIYPHYPSTGSTIYKIAGLLGYNLTNKAFGKGNITVYWEYNTHRNEYHQLKGIAPEIVNHHSRDISKVFVDNAFSQIFGYSTFIDPITYNKPFVKKNDINAKHDGEILSVNEKEREEGFIYQKLIDNSTDDEMVIDIRVPVVKGVLDFVYLKYRNENIRFTNSTSHTIVKQATDIFSRKELSLINRFCELINLDYGELDILRDNNDKKIYIVDVNNTPQGPPKHLPCKESKKALRKIANEFKTHYLQ